MKANEYIEECKAAGLQTCSSIVQALESPECVTLNLQTDTVVEKNTSNVVSTEQECETRFNGRIHEVHLRGILKCIKNNKSLRSLNLSGIGIDEAAMKDLSESLNIRLSTKAGKPIDSLILSNNRNLGNEATITFCEFLLKPTFARSIKVLVMRNIILTERATIGLGNVLPILENLQTLDLGRNLLTVRGCSALGKGIAGLNLLQVNLDECNLSDAETEELLAKMSYDDEGKKIESIPSIECINLEANRISNRGLKHISNVVTAYETKRINLSRNNIGDIGVQALACCLKNMHSLTELDMSYQVPQLGTVALESLCQFWKSESCNLVYANLNGAIVDDGALLLVGKTLSVNTSLQTVLLESDSVVSQSIFKEFSNALVANSTLVELSLPKGCDEETAYSIHQVLSLNKKLNNLMKRQQRRRQYFSPEKNIKSPLSSSGKVSSVGSFHNQSSIVKKALEDLMIKTDAHLEKATMKRNQKWLESKQIIIDADNDDKTSSPINNRTRTTGLSLEARCERVELLLSKLLEKENQRTQNLDKIYSSESKTIQRALHLSQQKQISFNANLEGRINSCLERLERRIDSISQHCNLPLPPLCERLELLAGKLQTVDNQNTIIKGVSTQIDAELCELQARMKRTQVVSPVRKAAVRPGFENDLHDRIGRVFDDTCQVIKDATTRELSTLDTVSSKTTSIFEKQLLSLQKRLEILEENIIVDRENTIRDLTIIAESAKLRHRNK